MSLWKKKRPNVYNFSAGPAMLPLEVKARIAEELFDWNGLGISVMELSHRSSYFEDLSFSVEDKLRKLLAVPHNYRILFLGSSTRAQFAMIPLNILRDKTITNYAVTGIWSEIAFQEAKKYSDAHIAINGASSDYLSIPPEQEWDIRENAAYFHYTSNETVSGVQFKSIPDISDQPLVCDATSDLLSAPLPINRFGIIYAGTQKNLGIAGMTIVIIRDDLLGAPAPTTPLAFNYTLQAKNRSLLVTPPTFSWYVTGLVLDWVASQGGVEILSEINHRKSKKLYDYIDSSHFYFNTIDPNCRSTMTVTFFLKDESKNNLFIEKANASGFTFLKGHSTFGGMRACLYNAMPEKGVDELIHFMQTFANL